MQGQHVNRIVLLANAVIGLILLIVGGFVWWYAWRPLAMTSGSLNLPVSQPVTVTRDSLGVAHIEAQSMEDALVAQGFVTAQDRLWQMDAMRRLAAGELSEVIGASFIEADQESRRLRLRRTAVEQMRRLSPDDRALFAAYARGVNHYIDTHRDKLPVEFKLLEYDPQPWGIQDSILAALQMYRSLSTTWKTEVLKRQMMSKGDRQKVEFLFPLRSGDEAQMGSNAWVISGKRTATGKPILANDTHLEWGFPSAWYMVHLKAPGLNVTGFSLPGLPAVIIGHNESIAWGVTNLHFDVQDLYLEEFDPLTGRYRIGKQVETARLETDVIRIKGGPAATVRQWVTRHGPVIHQEGAVAMALRWIAYEPNGFEYPFAQLNQARNWDEFSKALGRFPGPASNFVYADVQGNIGYRAAGRMPLRNRYAGDLPVSGTGEFEWDGLIPFDKLPSLYNPPSGLIVTANQNPFPAKYAYPVNGSFSSTHREKQIEALLSKKQGWKVDEMLAIQTDVYSAFSHFLAQETARAAKGKPGMGQAAKLLGEWNGQMHGDSSAALIVTLVYQNLRRAVADRAAPDQGAAYESYMAPTVVERLLRDRPAGWFTDWDAVIVKALSDAMAEGKKLQGDDVSSWSYGRYTRFAPAHPIISRVPYLGRYFNLTPQPMHGSTTTVKQTSRRLGPAMRFVADLANWDASLANITIGQSGQPLSSHFKDQWDAYYAGRSFPMRFAAPAGDRLVLNPAR